MSDEVENQDQYDTDAHMPMTTAQSPLPVDVDGALQWWNAYQELTEKLLDETDYQVTNDGKFKKKSAWRKYMTAFNISIEITNKDIIRDEIGRVVTAEYEVKATAPNGRNLPGVGACSIHDKSHEHDKRDKNGRVTCEGPCDGRKHFTHPEHDIPTTAYTRAVNRAISDMIGAGEVSAEEIGSNGNNKPKTRTQTIKTRQRPGTGLKQKMQEKKPDDTPPTGIDPENVQDAEITEKKHDWKALTKKSPALKKVCDKISQGGFDLDENTIYVEAGSMNQRKELTDKELDEIEVLLGRKA